MGTSKSYGGPKHLNQLLPPWADEPLELPPSIDPDPAAATKEPADESLTVVADWDEPRRLMARLARSGLRGGAASASLGRIASGTVRALGGARQASRTSRAGRSTTLALGAFLATVARRGIAEAANQFGIAQFLGQDVEVLLAGLTSVLGPDPALTEDAVAAEALQETLAALFEEYGASDIGIGVLDRLDEQGIRRTIERYLTEYIFRRVLHVFSERIEANSPSGERYAQIERDLRDYIWTAVEIDFGAVNLLLFDWRGQASRELVDQIFEEAYGMLEGVG
jgi:hypothetical protein